MDLISPNFSDLLKPNIEIKTFPDGDSYVRVENLSACEGREVKLYHRLYPDQNTAIFNALQILDTLKRADAQPTLVVPYLPYSRQDKTFKEGEALSAEILCSLFAKAGVKKLVTLDCHFLKKEGEFEYGGLKIKNISANKLLVEHAKSKLEGEDIEVISPDQGANYLVSSFGGKSMKKLRGEYEEGKEAYRKIEGVEMDFDVEGKNVLILDDMISTGGTMIRAVGNVRNGKAKKVFCAATHGFFLKGSLQKLSDITDGVFTTNSIANPVAELDVLPLLKE